MENNKNEILDSCTFTYPKYNTPIGLKLGKTQFLVDIKDPSSIGSILAYHIENFDQYVIDINQFGVEYCTIKEGKILAINHDTDTMSETLGMGEEQLFFYAAISYRQLWPLLEKYARLVIEACKKEKNDSLWSDEDILLGYYAVCELAFADKSYIPLFEEYAENNIEIKHSTLYQEDFREMRKILDEGFSLKLSI